MGVLKTGMGAIASGAIAGTVAGFEALFRIVRNY
jgi:hypothetical protein